MLEGNRKKVLLYTLNIKKIALFSAGRGGNANPKLYHEAFKNRSIFLNEVGETLDPYYCQIPDTPREPHKNSKSQKMMCSMLDRYYAQDCDLAAEDVSARMVHVDKGA